jgi:tripartite-type tricarboxylate transporter receptor subunit TctC
MDIGTPLGTALVKTVRSEAGKSTESIGEAQFRPRHRADHRVVEVNSSLPAKTVSDFIAYAKANLGKINGVVRPNAHGAHA